MSTPTLDACMSLGRILLSGRLAVPTPTLDAYEQMIPTLSSWELLAENSQDAQLLNSDWGERRIEEALTTLNACLAARDEAIRIRARAELIRELDDFCDGELIEIARSDFVNGPTIFWEHLEAMYAKWAREAKDGAA